MSRRKVVNGKAAMPEASVSTTTPRAPSCSATTPATNEAAVILAEDELAPAKGL